MEYELGRVSIYHQLPSEKPTLQLLEYLTNDAAAHAGWSFSIYRDEYSKTYTLSTTGDWEDSDGHNLRDVDDDHKLYGNVVELKDQFGIEQRFKVCVGEVINSWEHTVSFDCLHDLTNSEVNNVFGNTIFYNQDTNVPPQIVNHVDRSYEKKNYLININRLLDNWFSKTLDESSGCYIDSSINQFQIKLFANGTQHDYEVGYIRTITGELKRTVLNIDPCILNPILSQYPLSLHISNDIELDCSKPCEFYLGRTP